VATHAVVQEGTERADDPTGAPADGQRAVRSFTECVGPAMRNDNPGSYCALKSSA
jgi:hypothetical protein